MVRDGPVGALRAKLTMCIAAITIFSAPVFAGDAQVAERFSECHREVLRG